MGAKQGTTILQASTGAKGKSDSVRLKKAFQSSPLLNPDDQLNDDGSLASKMRAYYEQEVLNGTQNGNTLMGAVNMDYGKAPVVDDRTVDTGGEGKPAGAFVPSTASPGEGNGSNPTSMPEVDPVGGHNGDLGTVTSPNMASKAIGEQSLTNMPALGKSE